MKCNSKRRKMNLKEDFYNLLDVYITDYQDYKNSVSPLLENRLKYYKNFNKTVKTIESERKKFKDEMIRLYYYLKPFRTNLGKDNNIDKFSYKDSLPKFNTFMLSGGFVNSNSIYSEWYSDLKNNQNTKKTRHITKLEYDVLYEEIENKKIQYKKDIEFIEKDTVWIKGRIDFLKTYRSMMIMARNAISDRFLMILEQDNKKVPKELNYIFLKYSFDFYRECYDYFRYQLNDSILFNKSYEKINDKCQNEIKKIKKMIYPG